MESKDGVSSGRISIQIVLSDCPLQLSLEKAVQGLFLCVTDLLGQSLDGDTTTLVISDLQVLVTSDRTSGLIRQQVTNLLIVDLRVTDSDGDGLLELVACQSIELRDGSGDETAILEDGRTSGHRVGFTRTCLSIAEHCAIIALNDGMHDLASAHFVSFILARIMKNLLKVELPDVSLVVDDTEGLILILLKSDGSCVSVNLNIFAREVSSWPRANYNLYGLLRRHISQNFL